MVSRLAPRNAEEKQALKDAGMTNYQVFTCDDLVTSNDIFVGMTGITDGLLLQGVRYHTGTASTHSLVLRGRTQTRRYISTTHRRAHIEGL